MGKTALNRGLALFSAVSKLLRNRTIPGIALIENALTEESLYFKLLLSRQKLGSILENKCFKIEVFKNVNDKKSAPKTLLFNEMFS